MLPTLTERAFSNPNWLFEPKLDGYRVIATVEDGDVRLASRRGLDCSAEYPWLVAQLTWMVPLPPVVLPLIATEDAAVAVAGA